MRTIINSLIVAAFTLLFAACSKAQDQSAQEILQDTTKQNEIMETISHDNQMMMNMMGHIKNNNHAMQMMAENQNMMQDTTTSNMMMGNKHLMNTMKGMTYQKGMKMGGVEEHKGLQMHHNDNMH